MNIVIFGGSFNPIHTGHAMIANTVAMRHDVDEVWMMVSPRNPLKAKDEMIPEEERLRLVRLVADQCKDVKGSDFEFNLPRPSFTYNTLCELKKAYPEHNFKLLIGSDNWKIFNRWRDSERIISEFGVIIYQRPDAVVNPPFPEGVTLIEDVPMMMVSSSYIRSQLKEGRDVRFLVPDVIYNELEYGRK
ncbi:MAG: nicotinate-nucleotide adenylyltransferase [Muribaculaceae bacterium]|nr:nicotinate-nucleotide adenylyltransferase [Muribaculaceae bacterium]